MGDVLSGRNTERARRLLLVAGLAASFVPACAESDDAQPRGDAAPLDAARDAPTADASEDGAPEAALGDAGCFATDAGIIPDPPAACGAVESCLPEYEPCLLSALTQTVAPTLHACQDCGEIAVGFKAGCATAVVRTYSSSDPSKLKCLEQAILGRRWACAPAEGWARLYLGSCTLP